MRAVGGPGAGQPICKKGKSLTQTEPIFNSFQENGLPEKCSNFGYKKIRGFRGVRDLIKNVPFLQVGWPVPAPTITTDLTIKVVY